MSGFPESLKINVGIYIDKLIKWMMINFEQVFESLRLNLLSFLKLVEAFLLYIPWWISISLIILLGWKLKDFKSGFIWGLLLFFIGCLGYWQSMAITLSIVLTSTFVSVALGVPLGILMSSKNNIEKRLNPILDGMQTMPSFIYLIPAIMFFGLGRVPATLATMIYGLPPVIRLTNLGIREVPNDYIEVADSFGSSTLQKLTKVEIPEALPTISTGINQTIMMSLGMIVAGAMVGADGLGKDVLFAINKVDISSGFEAGLCIVFIAIVMDRISQGIVNYASRERFSKDN